MEGTWPSQVTRPQATASNKNGQVVAIAVSKVLIPFSAESF